MRMCHPVKQVRFVKNFQTVNNPFALYNGTFNANFQCKHSANPVMSHCMLL